MHDHVNIDYELLISKIKKHKPENWWSLYLFLLKSDFNKSNLTVLNYMTLDPGLDYFNKIIEVLNNLYPPVKAISDRTKGIDTIIKYDDIINGDIIKTRKMKAVYSPLPPLQK
jgi:hypothetical protein